MVILISGLPGAGKSTISSFFREHHDATAISTIINHKIIEDNDPTDPYYFLVNDELKYHMAFKPHYPIFIMERGIESTFGYLSAFDELNGTKRCKLFNKWFRQIGKKLPTPDLIVHLKIDYTTSISRRYPNSPLQDEGVWTDQRFLEMMESRCVEFIDSHYPKSNVKFIDASKSLELVIDEVKQHAKI